MMPDLRTEREFLRVSVDDSGEEVSCDEQHDANAVDAMQRRTTLHPEPYRDTGSISQQAARDRAGDWDRMIADIRTVSENSRGRFGADGLRLWESSRAYRTMADTVLLLDLCRDKKIWITITTHERVYNPTNWRDRKSLLEDAIDNETESAKTSDRTLRSVAARASKGRPHGRMPYGYRAVYDADTGKLIRREPRTDPDPRRSEADHIREAYERVAKGVTLYEIVADWETRGIRTRSGTTWKTSHLGRALIRSTYGGMRQHDPGWKQGGGTANPSALVRHAPGVWEPLVERQLWLAVNKILRNPKRRKHEGSQIKYEYSGVVRCAVCRGPMRVTHRRGRDSYHCAERHCVLVSKPDTDTVVETLLLAYLSQPEVYDRTFGGQLDTAALAITQAQLAEAERSLDELHRLGAARQLSPAAVARMEPPLLEEIQDLKSKVDQLETPDEVWSMLPPGKDIESRWAAAGISTRHAIAKRVCVPNRLGTPLVMKSQAPRGVSPPAIDRIAWDQEGK